MYLSLSIYIYIYIYIHIHTHAHIMYIYIYIYIYNYAQIYRERYIAGFQTGSGQACVYRSATHTIHAFTDLPVDISLDNV